MSLLSIDTDRPYLFRLIRTIVGEEESLVADLSAKQMNATYFKILGSYDLLEVRLLDSLDSAIKSTNKYGVLYTNSFPGLAFKGDRKKFIEAQNDDVSPSLILLKLNPYAHRGGIRGILRAAAFLRKISGDFIVLIGTGYYELYLWNSSKTIDNLYASLNKLRSLSMYDINKRTPEKFKCCSLLIDTITIPTISYRNVIESCQWSKLDGDITPLLMIKNTPGFENEIAKSLPAPCCQYIGSEDLLCIWKEPIKFRDYVEFIVNFRKTARPTIIRDTTTKIYNPENYDKGEVRIVAEPIDIRDNFLIEKIDSMYGLNVNHFVLGELTNLVSITNQYFRNGAFTKTDSDLMKVLISYLSSLIKEYGKAARKKDHTNLYMFESMILEYIDCFKMALSQRFANKSYFEHGEIDFQPTFGSALSRFIKAISLIPAQLFKSISETSPPNRLVECFEKTRDAQLGVTIKSYKLPWKGFLFFDLNSGYCMINSFEIISVPYKDIFKYLNWITISHEVSHAYFTRIEFLEVEKKLIEQQWKDYKKHIPTSDKDVYDDNIILGISELFAHWFDFRHFFNGNFWLYIWSIWRTYIETPRVYVYKYEYWQRSLFVFLCSDFDFVNCTIESIIKNDGDSVDESLVDLFCEYLDILRHKLNVQFGESIRNLELSEDEYTEIATGLVLFIHLMKCFERRYVNKNLINKIEKSYPKIQEHVEDILSGKIVSSKVQNPFLLLRRLLLERFSNAVDSKEESSKAMAYVFSCWKVTNNYG